MAVPRRQDPTTYLHPALHYCDHYYPPHSSFIPPSSLLILHPPPSIIFLENRKQAPARVSAFDGLAYCSNSYLQDTTLEGLDVSDSGICDAMKPISTPLRHFRWYLGCRPVLMPDHYPLHLFFSSGIETRLLPDCPLSLWPCAYFHSRSAILVPSGI